MRGNERKTFKRMIIVCLAGVAVCSAALLVYWIPIARQNAFYDSIATPQPRVTSNIIQTTPDIDRAPEDGGAIATITPEPTPPWEPTLDFAAYEKQFPGIVAWVHIEGTAVNYPVMQTIDNDYYLNRLPNGEAGNMGSIFMDCHNSPDFSDRNTLIYGHNMKAGHMFGSLDEYLDEAYWEAHPTATIYTPERDYTVQLYAGYILDASKEFAPYLPDDEAYFTSYLADVEARAIIKSDVTISAQDRLVSLCTCNYDVRNGRLILVGKLVEAAL